LTMSKLLAPVVLLINAFGRKAGRAMTSLYC
jgi:hypothetical protein